MFNSLTYAARDVFIHGNDGNCVPAADREEEEGRERT